VTGKMCGSKCIQWYQCIYYARAERPLYVKLLTDSLKCKTLQLMVPWEMPYKICFTNQSHGINQQWNRLAVYLPSTPASSARIKFFRPFFFQAVWLVVTLFHKVCTLGKDGRVKTEKRRRGYWHFNHSLVLQV